MRGTIIATTEHQWPYSKLPECSAPKNPDNSPEGLAHFPLYPILNAQANGYDITK